MCAHLVPLPPSSILVSPAVLRHSIPHLYKHSPSSTNSHAHAYRRHASKASDIAHLLDPSYSPTGAHHDHNQIYVDHAGEVHDPNFRLFVPTPTCVFTSDFEDDKDEDVSLYSTRQQPRRVSMPHCAPPIPRHTRPGICRSCVQRQVWVRRQQALRDEQAVPPPRAPEGEHRRC